MPKVENGQHKNGQTKNKAQKPARSKPTAHLPVVYPEQQAYFCCSGYEGPQFKPPITRELMQKMLGWREAREGETHLFEDEDGKRIILDHNLHNRPFAAGPTKKYLQDILTRQWAGPLSFPGETVNGEAFIVSRTGQVTSGQKRGVAFVLACQRWAKDKAKWGRWWKEEPVFETLLVLGASDDPRVVGTLDMVQARTLSDSFYTSSELWKDVPPGNERKERCRMLDTALDLLWKRSGAGAEGSALECQTHSASRDFLARHPKLIACVDELFRLNNEKGRAISGRGLSAGACAGLLYLMGSGASDPDKYLQGNPDPSEKDLDWGRWDKAVAFFGHLAGGRMEAVKTAVKHLKALAEEAEDGEPGGLGGRQIEKNAIVVRAWLAFLNRGEVRADDLELTYGEVKGRTVLLTNPTCGGIDHGDQQEPPEEGVEDDDEPSAPKETPAETKARIRREQAERAAKIINERRAFAKLPFREQLERLTEEAKGRTVLLELKPKGKESVPTLRAYAGQAIRVSQLLKLPLGKDNASGLDFCDLPAAELNKFGVRLRHAGTLIAIARLVDGVPQVRPWDGPDKDEPKPAPSAKPAAQKPAKARAGK